MSRIQRWIRCRAWRAVLVGVCSAFFLAGCTLGEPYESYAWAGVHIESNTRWSVDISTWGFGGETARLLSSFSSRADTVFRIPMGRCYFVTLDSVGYVRTFIVPERPNPRPQNYDSTRVVG